MTTKPRYDVGLIACTRGKNPAGVTPLTLYKGTPFTVAMKHATQRCNRILILSAKYGLLGLRDPVSYYDAYIPDLDAEQRQDLRTRVFLRAGPLRGERILSYLPKEYQRLLDEAAGFLKPTTSRPYQGLPMIKLVKVLSDETKGYGIHPQRR